ncbi:MAG: amino acid ABC transporter permease [Kurthia sp.]|nr:amino acid ABC transporter permease [Candidatus Kurthia equi]
MELILDNWQFLLKGAYYTLLITIISMFFGLILGMIIAIMRVKGDIITRNIARFYVSIIRGTPPLVQIFIIYYGLSDYGLQLSPIPASCIALSINIAAYIAEAFRGALQSVPKGQAEAAVASGMTEGQAMRRIIIPQAIRYAIPPIGNTFVGMLKETSLVSAIAVTELMRAAQLLISQYYVYMPFYITIAIMYWVMSTFFTFILGKVEKRLSVY